MKKLFGLIALIGLIVGFSTGKWPMVAGLGKAVAGVFFILWYIWLLFGNEPAEKTGH